MNDTIAIIGLIVTNAATLVLAITGWHRARSQGGLEGAQREQLEADIHAGQSNRRIELERYTDEIQKYHRTLRAYLQGLVDAGVIDVSKIDLTKVPQPPPSPKFNGQS